MKEYRVVMSPKINQIKENVSQHFQISKKTTNLSVEFTFEDAWKKGGIKVGSTILQTLSGLESTAFEDENRAYFFISNYHCLKDFTLNFIADHEEKYLILLFFYVNNDLQNSYSGQTISINSGNNAAYFSNDVNHQTFITENSIVKALSIYLPIEGLKKMLKNEDGSAINRIIDKDYQLFEVHEMDRFTAAIFEKFFSFNESKFIAQLNLQKDIYSLITNAFSYLNNAHKKTLKIKNVDITQLKKIRKLLIKDILTPPTIDQLAKAAAMSPSKLKKLFKEYYGESIYSYFLSHRMDIAHEMLVENKMSIKEVSNSFGYKNHSHFSRLFKSKFGKYPSQV